MRRCPAAQTTSTQPTGRPDSLRLAILAYCGVSADASDGPKTKEVTMVKAKTKDKNRRMLGFYHYR
jgi:hypothetical protein